MAKDLGGRRPTHPDIPERDLLEGLVGAADRIYSYLAGDAAIHPADLEIAEQGGVVAAAATVVIVLEADAGRPGAVAADIADPDLFHKAAAVLVGFKINGTVAVDQVNVL